jgi:hypothetical protein
MIVRKGTARGSVISAQNCLSRTRGQRISRRGFVISSDSQVAAHRGMNRTSSGTSHAIAVLPLPFKVHKLPLPRPPGGAIHSAATRRPHLSTCLMRPPYGRGRRKREPRHSRGGSLGTGMRRPGMGGSPPTFQHRSVYNRLHLCVKHSYWIPVYPNRFPSNTYLKNLPENWYRSEMTGTRNV